MRPLKTGFPERIICLSDETTEILYLLGEEKRIAGISCLTVRPPVARKEKPVISSFTGANINKIKQLNPDLILGFSDIQAQIVKDLISEGFQVHLFNQRTIQGILNMILTLGSMVGALKKAQNLIKKLKFRIEKVSEKTKGLQRRPIVYFEEWPEPLISGIGWVSELIEIAGGIDCFSELSNYSLAKDRIISDQSLIFQKNPDIILGSWCGKKFRRELVKRRKGWETLPAVRHGDIYEISSSIILQPGPAALTDGLDQLYSIFDKWAKNRLFISNER